MDDAAMRFVCVNEEHWRQQLEGRRILREENPENELSAKKIWRERKSRARHARFRVIGGRHSSNKKKNIPKRAVYFFNDAQWYCFLATPFSSASTVFKCIPFIATATTAVVMMTVAIRFHQTRLSLHRPTIVML
jgi:hypothetical protein